MADVFSKRKRSLIMARVKGHGNAATELRFIEILREHKISGWRRRRSIFGKPDFVFPAKKAAVFVDGCFWHGCPIHGSAPSTNEIFWKSKIARNVARDRLVNKQLKKVGWIVIRFWQHDLRDSNKVAKRLMANLARRRSLSDGALLSMRSIVKEAS